MTEIRVKKDAAARRFEMSIDIDAPADGVWNALTQADELTRWFPLDATVTPGEGGSIHWGWRDAWSWGSTIRAWEPNRRIRLVETRQGFDANGKVLDTPGANRDLVMDITLESRSGRTRVTLVHSGFGHGADWDDEFDGISSGWQYELRSLKHYVERHRGRNRVAAWARVSTDLPIDAAWQRLLQSNIATFASRRLPGEGEPFDVTLMGSERVTGTVAISTSTQFAGFAHDASGTIVRLDAFPGGGRTGLMVWVVSYDERDRERFDALERRAQAHLDAAFALAPR
jgi:uncharacterized protein YndB with AHSA1/START domain